MIRAIIFDCFGVLIEDALSVLSGSLEPSRKDEVRGLVQASNHGLLASEAASSQIAALLGLSVQDYRAKLREGEVKNELLMGYIRGLRPCYKTAMLSNVGSGGIARRFTAAELAAHFDAVVVSGEIGYAKPEPEAYEITADRLNVRRDECLFIDDREAYCEGARAVGMQAILYKDFIQFKHDLTEVIRPKSEK